MTSDSPYRVKGATPKRLYSKPIHMFELLITATIISVPLIPVAQGSGWLCVICLQQEQIHLLGNVRSVILTKHWHKRGNKVARSKTEKNNQWHSWRDWYSAIFLQYDWPHCGGVVSPVCHSTGGDTPQSSSGFGEHISGGIKVRPSIDSAHPMLLKLIFQFCCNLIT